MRRIAVGDLLVDVEVPDGFEAEYSLSGSLLLGDPERGLAVELSGLTVAPKDPEVRDHCVRDVEARAASRGTSPRRFPGPVAVLREDRSYLAGVGNRMLIATLSGPEDAAFAQQVEALVGSAAAAHDPLPRQGDEVARCPLRPSHALWFDQLRAALGAELDVDGLPPLGRLDALWLDLVAHPPEEPLLGRKLAALAVAFGDHLVARGFQWCIAADRWGTGFAVVALPETAQLLLHPESFVGKRWEQQEDRFLEGAVGAVLGMVEKAARDWAAGPVTRS